MGRWVGRRYAVAPQDDYHAGMASQVFGPWDGDRTGDSFEMWRGRLAHEIRLEMITVAPGARWADEFCHDRLGVLLEIVEGFVFDAEFDAETDVYVAEHEGLGFSLTYLG